MRTIGKILAMFLFAIFAINIVSCSDSDDEVNVDFLEVEIEGAKYTKQIDFHINSGVNSALAIWQTNVEINELNREDLDIMLAHYDRMSDLANCKAGPYSIEERDDYENFDLELGYNNGYDYYAIQKYSHIVTLIKRSGNYVIVEGQFTGKIKTLNKSINGRYRITLDFLNVDTDKQFINKYNEESNGGTTSACNNEISGYFGTLTNVQNVVNANSVTAYFDKNGETSYLRLNYNGKEELMSLIKTEGDYAKYLFNYTIESPLVKSQRYYYDDGPGRCWFMGFKYNITSLTIEGNSVVVRGNVEESYGSEWYNWDTGEGGWNECQEELFRYKIIIP